MVRSCRYVCANEGHRKEDKKDHLTKCPRSETRTNCQVRMSLIMDREKETFKVADLVLEHNHMLQLPQTSHLMVSQRKISELQGFEIETADDAGIRLKAAHELACVQVGGSFNLSYTLRDHKNYLRGQAPMRDGIWSCRKHDYVFSGENYREPFIPICIADGHRRTNTSGLHAILLVALHTSVASVPCTGAAAAVLRPPPPGAPRKMKASGATAGRGWTGATRGVRATPTPRGRARHGRWSARPGGPGGGDWPRWSGAPSTGHWDWRQPAVAHGGEDAGRGRARDRAPSSGRWSRQWRRGRRRQRRPD
jgi:hypothetical protein